MATEFARWSTSNKYGTYSYILTYDLLSQSIANNTSTIRVYGILQLPVYISWSRGTATVHTASFGLGTSYSAGNHQIGYTDVTFAHNNDGTGSVYIGGSISTSYLMNGSCGGTITVPNIPRYSTMSTAPNFNDEENPTITFTNPTNGYFSLRAKIEAGGNTQLIKRDLSKTATSCTFELTNTERETLRNLIPNSNSLSVRFTICAMNGETELNASFLDRTMTIVNGNPTFSDFEFEDLNSDTVALTGDDQAIIKGYSNIDIRIPVVNKAVANKGATMSKYRIVVGDYTEDLPYSDSAMVSSSTILKVSTGTMNVYAIDSRNNSTLVTKLATREIDYTPATISSSSKIERNDSGVGTSGILTYSGTYWNDNFGDEVNAIESVSYEFKPTSSSTWETGTTDITPTISNNDFSFTGIVRSNASDYTFDIATSYDFRITITDKLTTIVYVFTPLASGTPNLALSENGTAIGMAYDESEGGAVQLVDDVKLYDSANDEWKSLGGVKDSYSTSTTDSYSANYVNNNFINKPTILWQGTSTQSGITLSESVVNYSYLEIYFHTNDGSGYRGSQKVVTGAGTTIASLQYIHCDTQNHYWIKAREILINGTSITNNGYIETGTNGTSSANYIYITKVLGYK